MKKIIFALSTLCLVFSTSCKEDATSKIKSDNVVAAAQRDATSGDFPVISFAEAEHDFGTIMNGTPVETKFVYTNTGKTPLVVSNIKSTCGCTVPSDWNRNPLAPGESSEFTVKFNGKGSNQVQKVVTLTTNTEKGSETVKIKAFVQPDPNAPAKKKPVATPVIPSK